MKDPIPARRRGWPRSLALLAVVVFLLVLAVATFTLSYSGIHVIALRAGMSAHLARFYPGLLDAALVIACLAAVLLHDGRWWARWYAWLAVILIVAVGGGANALHAMNVTLPHRQTAGAVAAAPWVLLLLAFSLWLTILRQSRSRRDVPRQARETPQARQTQTVPLATMLQDPEPRDLEPQAPAPQDPEPRDPDPQAPEPQAPEPQAVEPQETGFHDIPPQEPVTRETVALNVAQAPPDQAPHPDQASQDTAQVLAAPVAPPTVPVIEPPQAESTETQVTEAESAEAADDVPVGDDAPIADATPVADIAPVMDPAPTVDAVTVTDAAPADEQVPAPAPSRPRDYWDIEDGEEDPGEGYSPSDIAPQAPPLPDPPPRLNRPRSTPVPPEEDVLPEEDPGQ
ncbi:MAG: DUF2637 domain-containing protein [Nocardiopsaceae bacterium]|nr:DUF2637 domain-containing protein [Nocardiopsaceae bacterium]